METFGRFGDIARNILKTLIDILSINSGKNKAWLSTYWKSKLVITMRKLYIQGMRNHFSSLNIQDSELSLQSQEEIENINYQNIFLRIILPCSILMKHNRHAKHDLLTCIIHIYTIKCLYIR